MKYIINIEPIKGTSLHKATKFNTLVFDEEGLRRLEKVKEKPSVMIIDHVAEELEKLGYEVDKGFLARTCPIPHSEMFIKDKTECTAKDINLCVECQKWWFREYKPEQWKEKK